MRSKAAAISGQVRNNRKTGVKPKVSVLTTVYNGVPLLDHAMTSLLQQTFDDWEHIIVDDGSTDATMELVKSYNDPRIRLIEAGRIGRGVALNLGLSACQGDYIAILDADDMCSRFRLEEQIKVLEANPHLDLLCGVAVLDAQDLPVEKDNELAVTELSPRGFVKRNPIIHTTVAVRRAAILAVSGYDESRHCLFDFDLWLRLAQANYVMAFCNTTLAMKRKHAGQYFENKKRLPYLYEGLIVRYRAAALFGISTIDYIYPIAGFVYGLLPSGFRMNRSKRRAAVGKFI